MSHPNTFQILVEGQGIWIENPTPAFVAKVNGRAILSRVNFGKLKSTYLPQHVLAYRTPGRILVYAIPPG